MFRSFLCGMGESDSRPRFGKPTLYHLTNPAYARFALASRASVGRPAKSRETLQAEYQKIPYPPMANKGFFLSKNTILSEWSVPLVLVPVVSSVCFWSCFCRFVLLNRPRLSIPKFQCWQEKENCH